MPLAQMGAGAGGYGGLPQQQQQYQFFTPGLGAENQFAAQQYQQQYGAGGHAPDSINAPGAQQQQQPAYHPQMSMQNMADQFGNMGLGGTKPFALYTTNLLTSPPDPIELNLPPPEIRLPPNTCLSPNPFTNADPSYQCCTLNAVPATSSVLSKCKLPFALVLTPYRSLKGGDPPVPLVTDQVIARCQRCRMHINPFVQFIDGEARWRCTLCAMSNEDPQMFDWNQEQNQPADPCQRTELNHAVVEHVAPTEYMVRPPRPVFQVFLIDVSHAAASSGMQSSPRESRPHPEWGQQNEDLDHRIRYSSVLLLNATWVDRGDNDGRVRHRRCVLAQA